MAHDYVLPIESQQKISEGIFLLSFKSRSLASAAQPGQFVQLRVDKQSTYLRRPLSIHDAHNDTVHLLYKVQGKGTDLLSRKKPGAEMGILGPLGNGFILKKQFIASFDTVGVVAGGIGIAPLFFLLRRLKKDNVKRLEIFFGACNRKELILRNELEKFGFPVHYATDDCSCGHGGRVTTLVSQRITESRGKKILLYACGPEPMYASLQDSIAKEQVYVEALFERVMGCGFGVCNSCSIMTVHGMRKVCVDGPAFNLAEVVMEKGGEVCS